MKIAEKKWSNVKQLLRERENQLELSLGTTVVFLQTVAELLAWLEEKSQLEAISATPPASVESLKGFVEIVEVMCRLGRGDDGGRRGRGKCIQTHRLGGGEYVHVWKERRRQETWRGVGRDRQRGKCGEESGVTHMHPDGKCACRVANISEQETSTSIVVTAALVCHN